MIPTIRTFLTAAVFSLPLFAGTTDATGALQGSVIDVQAGPLSGAAVRYERVYKTVPSGPHGKQLIPAPGEAIVSGEVMSDSSGAFMVTSLPQGDYLLCASVPFAAYLDPCAWQGAFLITVSPDSTAQQTIGLTKGVFLKVRINDPMGLLPSVVDGPVAAQVAVGAIFGRGAYLGAQNTGVDSGGRDYQMVVPAGTPLNLWVHSSSVAIADPSGNAIPTSGAQIPFEAAAGLDQAFTITVSGILQPPPGPVLPPQVPGPVLPSGRQ